MNKRGGTTHATRVTSLLQGKQQETTLRGTFVSVEAG